MISVARRRREKTSVAPASDLLIEAGRGGGKGDETRGCRRADCPLKRVVRVRGERHEPLVRSLGFSGRDCCRRAGTERMQIKRGPRTRNDQTEQEQAGRAFRVLKTKGAGGRDGAATPIARLQGGR